MVALLLILHDRRVAINAWFKHLLQSDQPQLSSACTKSQLSHVSSKIFNLKGKRLESTRAKFATFARKLFKPVANCSEQTANQNTNISAEVCKVARKRASGLTVKVWQE